MPNPDGTTTGRRAIAASFALFSSAALPAAGQSVSLTARSVYHGYQLQLDPRGPSDRLRSVDRVYAAVEGGAFRLGNNGQFDVVASLRYDTDFGGGYPLDTFYAVPIDGRNDIDILFMYLDWRNMIGKEFGLRVGRQFQVDDLDWYVFDGLKLIGQLWRDGPNRFDLDIYAGVPVRFDTLFASAEAILGDGTEIYDGEIPFGGTAAGAAAYLRIFQDLALSLSWRNELVFRDRNLIGFGPAVVIEGERRGEPIAGSDQTREAATVVSAETVGLIESLVGASIGYSLRPIDVTIQGSIVFDALANGLDRARVLLGYDPARNLHFGAEYSRVRPRFLADSIFNWFHIFPYDRARVEGDITLLEDRLTLEFSYFAQWFNGAAVQGRAFDGGDIVHGPGGGVRWRDGPLGLSAYVEASTSFDELFAYGGNYLLGFIAGDFALFSGRFVADARVSLTSVERDWVVGAADGVGARTTVTVAVGARADIFDWLSARALFVQNIDPVLEGNHRVFTELAVRYQ